MPPSRGRGSKAKQAQKQQSKKTFIVKLQDETKEVVNNDPESFTQTIILEEKTTVEGLNEFSFSNRLLNEDNKDDFNSQSQEISLELGANEDILNQNSDIRNHVISIEENGHITIDKIAIGDEEISVSQDISEKRPHQAPKFPEWWLRLSSTMLSFLSTGYLVDAWLVCCDGEAVPAHQLILGHASSTLRSMLQDAARDAQEEAVTISLPDWDSDTVGQFVSALYQGQLPALVTSQVRIQELAQVLGVQLHKQHQKITNIVRKKIPAMVKTEEETKALSFLTPTSNNDSPEKQLNMDKMQFVQTESGLVVLLTQPPDTLDDEVERVKAVKIAEIKEQQSKQCPQCYKTALEHRVVPTGSGNDHKFAYTCCQSDCSVDNLKTARAFNQHIIKHGAENMKNEDKDGSLTEVSSKLCPVCYRPRIEHKNRSIKDEDKSQSQRGNVYKCCRCAASKLSSKKFFIHMENHISKKHVCDICGKGYSYQHLLNEHHYKEHGEGQNMFHPCPYDGCDYSTKYKQTLHTHVTEKHQGLKRKHKGDGEQFKTITCPTCNKSLKRWYYNRHHRKTCSAAAASGTQLYQCELCGKDGFVNALTLENHKKSKHSMERPHACEYCPAKYATAMSLSGHRSRKHGVNCKGESVPKKVYPCNVCGKMLTSRLKLISHVQVLHQGKRNFKCRFCDKSFGSKSNLQVHEGSMHTGVLPYKCDFCSKSFARRGQLQSHTENQHPGHAGPFYVVEDVDSVQDIILEDGVEISVGVDGVNIMEGVAIG